MMKNQYFGDINDYRKYGLLRSIIEISQLRVMVAWMLTPDDSSTDGNFATYLNEPEKWSIYDPELYFKIRDLLDNDNKQVSAIEHTGMLPGTTFFPDYVPDLESDRVAWFQALIDQVEGCELVFLDPDNGIEIKSMPYGSKNSSKFIFWSEIETLWESGKSLLIYQHFIREKRIDFIQRMLEKLSNVATDSLVEAFSTPHVVFLLALQPQHHEYHSSIVNHVQEKWEGQIQHWDQVRTNN